MNSAMNSGGCSAMNQPFIAKVNAFLVANDLRIYDEAQDEPCRVRSMELLESLGQVPRVFSDKTCNLQLVTRNV